MKRVALMLTVVSLLAPASFAQATRTWVSGVGDDANPCSRTAPCKTFAGAISKTANGGQISVLDPGGFGAVTITKSITIDGTGQLASINNALTNGIIVNATVNDKVVIRGVQIDGSGTGLTAIRVLSAKSVRIEDVTIWGQSNRGIDIQPSSLVQVTLVRTNIYNCGGIGIVAQGTTPGAVKLAMMDSSVSGSVSHGMFVFNGDTVTVENSLFSHNGIAGVLADGANTHVTVSHSNFSENLTGVMAGNGSSTTATVWLFDNEISGNNTGVFINGGIAQSHGNNSIRGNSLDVSGTIGSAGLQ